LRFECVDDRFPREDILLPQLGVNTWQARLMRKEPADWNRLFAASAKLRPVVGDLRIEIELAPLNEKICADGGRAFIR
jgi:hypothetical protein